MKHFCSYRKITPILVSKELLCQIKKLIEDSHQVHGILLKMLNSMIVTKTKTIAQDGVKAMLYVVVHGL